MFKLLRRRSRNGFACGPGLDEIVTSVEQQADADYARRG